MSASVYYRHVKPGKNLPLMAPSHFIESMTKAIGCGPPWIVTAESIPILRGMAAVFRTDRENPYEILIEEIERYGSVQLEVEY